jgi:uncharacterized membrane protein YozB (DUF420 family)
MLNLQMKGFLGTWATFAADLNLVIQLTMGVSLIAGTLLARAKRYRAHAICQTTVVILNLVMIAMVMEPSFGERIVPRLATRLSRPYYAIVTLHAALGTVAELLGLYILLVAGTNILPQSWRFTRWKLWMRIELILWWLVIFIGILTYYVWYAGPIVVFRLVP